MSSPIAVDLSARPIGNNTMDEHSIKLPPTPPGFNDQMLVTRSQIEEWIPRFVPEVTGVRVFDTYPGCATVSVYGGELETLEVVRALLKRYGAMGVSWTVGIGHGEGPYR